LHAENTEDVEMVEVNELEEEGTTVDTIETIHKEPETISEDVLQPLPSVDNSHTQLLKEPLHENYCTVEIQEKQQVETNQAKVTHVAE